MRHTFPGMLHWIGSKNMAIPQGNLSIEGVERIKSVNQNDSFSLFTFQESSHCMDTLLSDQHIVTDFPPSG